MKKLLLLSALAGLIVLMSFRSGNSSLFKIPEGWPTPEYNFKKKPLSKNKIELGRKLFYDPALSRDSTISCASCHSPYNAFTHVDHNVSHGIGGKFGTRNAPALMNLAWSKSFMWDGAVKHLDEQALKPISNPVEMDENIAHIVTKLQNNPQYPALFYKAFGDSVITDRHVLTALTQFILTLVSSNSKYDSVKRGEANFTDMEAKGYVLYRAKCAACHTEPLFTNEKFENNGLAIDGQLKDIGAMKVSGKKEDSLKFKVPTLRNVQYSAPYMHDGRFKNLSQVFE